MPQETILFGVSVRENILLDGPMPLSRRLLRQPGSPMLMILSLHYQTDMIPLWVNGVRLCQVGRGSE